MAVGTSMGDWGQPRPWLRLSVDDGALGREGDSGKGTACVVARVGKRGNGWEQKGSTVSSQECC